MRTKGLLAPCYKCEEREIGCHAVCEKYQEYSAEVKRRTKVELEQAQGYINWRQRRKR